MKPGVPVGLVSSDERGMNERDFGIVSEPMHERREKGKEERAVPDH